MMNDLEVPLSLTGAEINTDQALAKEVISVSVATIKIRSRRLNWEVHQPELFIDAHLGPNTSVSINRPGIILPGLVSELTGPWNCVKSPQLFARPDIECSHLSFGIVVGRYSHSLLHRHADHNDILHHGWR